MQIAVLLLNAFIHFTICYAALDQHPVAKYYAGLFTLIMAVIHFAISLYIYKKDLADKQLYYVVSGLVLVFLTLAIPIQLDGNWVTCMWSTEGLLLFWIGRSKRSKVYELLSYPVILLATISLLSDWGSMYSVSYYLDQKIAYLPFFNVDFLSSSITVAAFGVIALFTAKHRESNFGSMAIVENLLRVLFLLTLYLLLYIEISRLFDLNYFNSLKLFPYDDAHPGYSMADKILSYSRLSLILYTVVFISILTSISKRNSTTGRKALVILILNGIGILFYLTQGLYELSEMREKYLNGTDGGHTNFGDLLMRYPAIFILAWSVWINRKFALMVVQSKRGLDWLQAIFHVIVIWVLSSELLHWLDIAESKNTYKLGLSLLWGSYSLGLIAFGIWKRKQIIRIVAFALFGFTLVKLFFYDIASLSTISKTLAMVILGILLLIISFLYNKYKHLINEDQA